MRSFLEIDDLSPTQLLEVLSLANDPSPPRAMAGAGAGLVFEKPSVRTRNSMEMAVVQLGGHPVTIRGDEVGIDTRETAEDLIRVLAGYYKVVALRVFDHKVLERMVAQSVVPVVNLLSDEGHPMQALADLMTIHQVLGRFEDVILTYVGDANNVWRSLALACAMVGIHSRVACPPDYAPSETDLDRIRSLGGAVTVFDKPFEAVEGADVVYTDVWTSMGQEAEGESRRRAFEGFTVNEQLLGGMADHGVFLHCLPAHRGEEVADDAIESDRSRVFLQAENRMHVARGLLAWLLRDTP